MDSIKLAEPFKIGRTGLWKMIVIAILVTCVIGGLVFYMTRVYVIHQAEGRIEDLLFAHKGIHHYVQQVMHPALYSYKTEGDLSKEFYAPELFSSSFIIRNQHAFYNKERVEAGLPELYYKMAAINPRNPINQADFMEETIVKMFNDNPDVKKFREIITLNGKKYLYVALPFLKNDKGCLVCHGRREDAPSQLRKRYEGAGGYNEKIGYIRGIISIRAPLEREYINTYIIFSALLSGVIVIVSLFLLSTQLNKRVRSRTISLEMEINERCQVEKALVYREQRYRSLFDESNDGVVLHDLQGNIIDTNSRMNEIMGYEPGELQKKSVQEIHHVSEQEASRQAFENTVHNGHAVFETRFVKKDGSVIFADVSSSIVDHKEGLIQGIIRDISDRKEMEEHLRAAQKMESIGNLAGGIAHDFNNILFPIVGMSEMLLEDLPRQSQEYENVQVILNAGNRAGELVKQILTFSRQTEHKLIPVRVQHILREVLKLIRSTVPSYIEIKQDIQSDCGLIMADPTQIHQVSMNIITNAFHAVESKGGKITVSLKEISLALDELTDSALCPGRYTLLSISDNGHGIPADLMPRIFEPYFTTKEQGKGTGLGLAVVYGIVKEHGGNVRVFSETGKGTIFKIYLPLMDKPPDIRPVDFLGKNPTGKERILIVDDEKSIVKLEQQMLERLGYNVTTRVSSLAAIETFKFGSDVFDLVITDMTMPNMTGDQLARELLLIRTDIPIIICTGYSERINKEKAELIGIKGILTKPVVKSDLAHMVRKVLDETNSDI